MHACPPARSTRLRDRLLIASTVPGLVLAAASVQTDAVAERFVNKVGLDVGSFRLSTLLDRALAPAGGAGKTEIRNLLIALVAVVLLAAIIYFLIAVVRTFGGRRGGVEGAAQVLFALVMAIAGLEILA